MENHKLFSAQAGRQTRAICQRHFQVFCVVCASISRIYWRQLSHASDTLCDFNRCQQHNMTAQAFANSLFKCTLGDWLNGSRFNSTDKVLLTVAIGLQSIKRKKTNEALEFLPQVPRDSDAVSARRTSRFSVREVIDWEVSQYRRDQSRIKMR